MGSDEGAQEEGHETEPHASTTNEFEFANEEPQFFFLSKNRGSSSDLTRFV
jgi:hypothetical protein